MDVLADVISTTRIGGTVFCRSELSAPFGMAFEPAAVAAFHVVVRGGAWLQLSDAAAPVRLESGDVVLLPHGTGHSISDATTTQVLPFAELVERHGAACVMRRSQPDTGADTVLLCGAYRFEADSAHPLLALLPPLIHIPAQEGRIAEPMAQVLELLVREYSAPALGSQALVSRLVDALFVYVLRAWTELRPGVDAGWLAALSAPGVGRALSLMHAETGKDWSLAELASEAGMSRASLSRRFKQLVGEPPLTYLTRWRMDVAARLLRDSDLSLAEVAERVGYRSEFAFNRAFRRQRNTPPGRYREASRTHNLEALHLLDNPEARQPMLLATAATATADGEGSLARS